MIKTILVACLSAAAYADPQVLLGAHHLHYAGLAHGAVLPAVGAVHHSAVVTNVVETPAEVAHTVTPIAATYVAHPGYGYAGHLGYGYGLGHAGHLIHKREAEAEPEADADAYYYGYGHGYGRYHGYYGLGYRGYGYGHHGYYGYGR